MAIAVILALILMYLLVGLLLGLLPRNASWKPAEQGVAIYLENNGVHSAIIMPVRSPVMDWHSLFPATQVSQPAQSAQAMFVSVSWGSRTFFLQARSWGQLTVGKAVKALLLDNSVLHVEYYPAAPREDADTRKIVLSQQQYSQLVYLIRGTVPTGQNGQAVWVSGEHYYNHDAFYEGKGEYSPLTTCNEWTRRMLAAIGVRTPVWSPFVQPLFWQLEKNSKPSEKG